MAKQVVLITGASSGIGEATAKMLLKNGHTVYAAARRIERMKGLKKKGAKLLAMDVTDEESMQKGIKQMIKEQGRIDALVNNAGYGSYGTIEDVPIDEARRQFEVNIFGLARLTQLVLPYMRKKRYGRIINISSMGGKIYTPMGGWYHATKHALEGFSDCLRLETEEFGIDVVVIEPGGIKTDWGAIAADNLLKTSGSGAYKKQAKENAKMMKEMYGGDKLSPPAVIANAILKAITAKRPKTRYAVGYMSAPSIFMRKVLPDRMFDKMIRSMGG